MYCTKSEFDVYARERSIEVFDNLSDVLDTDRELHVGDEIYFVNDYGVTFGPRKILGFCKPEDNRGRCIYWDTDAYWFPAKPCQIFTPAEYDDFCNQR
jgi:hypothetical protein